MNNTILFLIILLVPLFGYVIKHIEVAYGPIAIRKNIIYNKWINFVYKINIVNNNSISDAVKSLFSTTFNYLDDNTLIYIQFKVKEDPSRYRSISYVQSITKKDMNEMIDFFITLWNTKSDDYPWDYIILTYKITSNEQSPENKTEFIEPIKERISKIKLPGLGYRIPLTTDFRSWGTYIKKLDEYHIINNIEQNLTYMVKVLEDRQEVKLMHKNKRQMFTFTDIFIDNNKDPRTFIRTLKDRKWHIVKGFIELHTQNYTFSFMKPLKKDLILKTNIITMDLETRTMDGKMESFCLSIYENEKIIKTFYLSDYKDEKDMRFKVYYETKI